MLNEDRILIIMWGRVMSPSETQKNKLMCNIKWLNFNSDLSVPKPHICYLSKGGSGEWSVEMEAVGPPIF